MLFHFPHLVAVLKSAGWEESKHPRSSNGQFGSRSGSSPKGNSATDEQSGETEPSILDLINQRHEQAQTLRRTGAIRQLLSGGSALDKISTRQQPAPEDTPNEEPSVLDTMAASWARADALRRKVPTLEHPSQQSLREGGREDRHSPRVMTPNERQYRDNQRQWDNDRRRMGIPVPGDELATLTIPGKQKKSASSESRDYAQEYRDYHGKPAQIKERAQRNAARRKLGLKPGDGKEADHKNPISNGGSNSSRNLRAVSRDTNRKKGSKVGKDDDWQESKHPRAANGQFGSGGSGSSSSGKKPSKTKRKQERRAEEASQGKVTGAIQTLLSGGSALDNVKWFKQPEAKPKAEEKKPASQPATFEDIAGKPPAQIRVEGSIDPTKPYIMRISGKTPDHSKRLKLSQLGFKWGNQSKTWYKGIEPREGEDAKDLLVDHINRVVGESGTKSPLKATIEQGKFKPARPSASSSANGSSAKPTNGAPNQFPSNPNDGKPGAIPAHELGSMLSDIDDMETEIVRYNGRRPYEPEVKLSAPISELKRRIDEMRTKFKASEDRLTPAARYEVLSEYQYNKIRPGRRSGPTQELRELGESGELYKK